MKSQGFAFSSKEDTKNSFERLCKRTNDNQFYTNTQIFPEWNLAIQKAFDSMKKRQQTLTKTKNEKDKYPNVNWNRIRELGYTNNVLEAGYITLDGKFIDLSGKKGQPYHAGERNLDHRELGGTKGMQEAIAYGLIRCDANSGNLDMYKMPTKQQLTAINYFLSHSPSDEFVIDMSNGLGPENQSYYAKASMSFTYVYPHSIPKSQIITDIINYWKNPSDPKYQSGYKNLSDKE